MPRDGNGTYNAPEAEVVTGTPISSASYNASLADLGAALTQSLSKDGQTSPTANLPMATYKHTNVGNASLRNEYATLGQVQDAAAVWGGTAGGTANAATLTLSPAIAAYSAGMVIRFVPSANNTGAVTLNVNGVGATAVVSPSGTACTSGELRGGLPVTVLYNGTSWVLQDVLSAPMPTTSTGLVGSIQAINSGTGSSLTLPANGVWVAWWIGVVVSSGTITGVPEMAEAAGGTTVKSGTSGVAYYGWAWRKA